MRNDLESRRGLSFAQAEGAEALPCQLQREQLSPRLRSLMWSFFHDVVYRHDSFEVFKEIMEVYHIYHLCLPADEFDYQQSMLKLKRTLIDGSYIDFYGALQFMLHCRLFTGEMTSVVASTLEREYSAFRIVERTLVPLASEHEAQTISSAIETSKQAQQLGAHAHLTMAVRAVAAGAFAECVKESIAAVEAVARTLSGQPAKLSDALSVLERDGTIHGSLKKAFSALYGYTSDEPGLRHALLERGEADVDEADALLMLGTCSSFVSYILAKRAKQTGA